MNKSLNHQLLSKVNTLPKHTCYPNFQNPTNFTRFQTQIKTNRRQTMNYNVFNAGNRLWQAQLVGNTGNQVTSTLNCIILLQFSRLRSTQRTSTWTRHRPTRKLTSILLLRRHRAWPRRERTLPRRLIRRSSRYRDCRLR